MNLIMKYIRVLVAQKLLKVLYLIVKQVPWLILFKAIILQTNFKANFAYFLKMFLSLLEMLPQKLKMYLQCLKNPEVINLIRELLCFGFPPTGKFLFPPSFHLGK